jgi:hypothetical protein
MRLCALPLRCRCAAAALLLLLCSEVPLQGLCVADEPPIVCLVQRQNL